MPAFLQPDIQQVISQAISFLLLLAILKKFAWKPLLDMLDQRRRKIEEDLRSAAHQKSEMERLQREYQTRLAAIEEEARTKIQQSVLEGKRIGAEVQEQAREQAVQILAKSKETLELELAKARVTLRDQVAAMTVGAVERILRQRLDAAADQKLIETILGELEQEGARKPR